MKKQKTREEILAKRSKPIVEIPVGSLTGLPFIRKIKTSKYMPHFGKKQQAKLAKLAG